MELLHPTAEQENTKLAHSVEMVEPSEVHYYGDPSERIVLFLHGAGTDTTDYEPLFTDLIEQTGVQIVAPAGPGVGETTPLESGEDISHRASLVLEMLISKYGLENILVIGHSHGGWEALGLLDTVNRLRAEGALRAEDMHTELTIVTIATPVEDVDTNTIMRSLITDSKKRELEAAQKGDMLPFIRSNIAAAAVLRKVMSNIPKAQQDAAIITQQMDDISTPEARLERDKKIAGGHVVVVTYEDDTAAPHTNPNVQLPGHHMSTVQYPKNTVIFLADVVRSRLPRAA